HLDGWEMLNVMVEHLPAVGAQRIEGANPVREGVARGADQDHRGGHPMGSELLDGARSDERRVAEAVPKRVDRLDHFTPALIRVEEAWLRRVPGSDEPRDRNADQAKGTPIPVLIEKGGGGLVDQALIVH